MTTLNCASPRTIIAAFYNNYIKGIVHPDRILKEHDFVYLVSGEWEITQNGESFPLKAGDLIILRAGAHHGGVKPCLDGTKTIYVHTSATEKELSQTEATVLPEEEISFDTMIHCQDHPSVKKTLDALVGAFASKDLYREIRLESLFRLLLLQLYDAMQSQSERDFIKKAVWMIQSNPQTFYQNAELSACFSMCPKSFIHHFKQYTGLTPHQYQLKYKLQEIENILATQPDLKLHELARNYGFYDEFHLSRAFKRVYGVSPSEYRARRTEKGR